MKRKNLTNYINGLLLAALSAIAFASDGRAQSKIIRVEIPFEFSVSEKALSSGTYSIQNSSNGAILVRSDSGKNNLVTIPLALLESRNVKSKPRLVFTRYGSNYFLKQIWFDYDNGRQLNKSKTERAVQHEFQIAKRDAKPISVEIVAIVN